MNEFVYIPGYISFQGVSEEEEQDDVDQVLKLKVFLITSTLPHWPIIKFLFILTLAPNYSNLALHKIREWQGQWIDPQNGGTKTTFSLSAPPLLSLSLSVPHTHTFRQWKIGHMTYLASGASVATRETVAVSSSMLLTNTARTFKSSSRLKIFVRSKIVWSYECVCVCMSIIFYNTQIS